MCAAKSPKPISPSMDKMWDNGFRETTSSTKPINGPDDFKGFKIRVPVSPLWTSMFKAFDAAPASINFSEVYSALQTKVVEGQENPLAIISTAKLYEVQKYCSLTNHMWDGFWFLANRRAWEKLPEDVRTIVARNINAAAVNERGDVAKLNAGLRQELAGKGLTFNQPETAPFREKLRSAGFYSEWKGKYGDEAWALLEKVRRQTVVTGCQGTAMAQAEASRAATGEAMSPRRRSLAASLEARLAMLVEIPAALLVVAEIVILFAGVVARYGLHRPLDLVGRTGIDPVPLAGDAGRCGGVSPVRAHANDRDCRQRKARDAGLSRRGRDLRGAGLSAADRVAGVRIRLRRKLHHHAGAANFQRLARRGTAGRRRPDGAYLHFCGWRAPAISGWS